MYYAYMLRSESTKRHYYGHTSDLGQRIASHNSTQNTYPGARGRGSCLVTRSVNPRVKQ